MDPLQTAQLGTSDVQLTRLGLGTAPLGRFESRTEVAEAQRVVELALSSGITYLDTAPFYGSGRAEETVGSVLFGRTRESLVLSTKVGRLVVPDGTGSAQATRRTVFDFSYDGVMRSLDESLARLQLDRVDVVFIHDPDEHYDTALHGAYRALRRLRDEGVVRAIGVGMNTADLLARFALDADFDCFLLAGRYSLLDQSGLDELLPLCAERGIGIVAGGVFNSGVLANSTPQSSYFYRPVPDDILERVGRIQTVCARHAVPLKAAAVQFPFTHPAIVSVLVGVDSSAELEEDIDMFRHPIPAGLWSDLQGEGLLSPRLDLSTGL